MPTFAETATADCAAIYEALKAAHAAYPGSPEIEALHKALKQGMDDLAAEHPDVVSPSDGTPKT
jgi:hypothetical protein